jgi:putative tricarboxylic transport membrane protein
MIQGIQPGPTIITEQATLFWGVVVSMWVGNVFLLILNLPLIGLWVRMITVPYHLLYPAIIVFCAIGVYSISNTIFDVYLMALFGLLGYVFRKFGCEATPLLLGFILGPPMEEHLRRALVLSEGRPDVLLREPVSACLLAVAAVLLASVLLPAIRKKREETFVSES